MNPKRKFDILVAGEINPDMILSGNVEPAFGQVEKLVESAELAIGSSSAIFACGAARLGLRVAFVGLCGEDTFGRFMLEEINSRGVDTSSVLLRPGGKTGLSVILNKGADRAILTHTGLIDSLTAGEVKDDLLSRARHLHVASYFLQKNLQPGLADLFSRAHTLGLSNSLDTNWDPSGQWQGINEILPQVDVFLPNEKEALALARTTDLESALEQIAATCRVVAIKLGRGGAIARRGDTTARAPAVKVEVVDTIGAGDAFDAGFLYGFLHGWELEKSLGLATACGSLSTRRAGGTAAQPGLEEAMQHVPPLG